MRALLTLGVPLIGGHLAQFAVQATDTIMLGWYDVEALAAVVLAGSLFFVIFILGAGFGFAVMPLVAEASANDEGAVQVRRVTRMGLWLSLIFAALAIVPMLLSEPILLAMGQTPVIARAASSYLQIAGWGVVPALGVMVLKSYLAALERAQVVLWVTILAAVVNAAVNWVLIFGQFGFPEMGIRGAAIASVMVQVVSFIGLVIYALRAFPEHALFQRFWRPDWGAFAQVFRLGWPIGLTNLTEVGLFAASAVMIGWLGPIPLAAHGIALELASATFLVHLGLSNATTIRTGKAMGRGDIVMLRRGGLVAIALSGMFALLGITVFLIWPEPLIGLFLSPEDPERPSILLLGTTLLGMAALFQLADGAQVMAHGLLRGVQDTRVPMVISALAYWGIGMSCGYMLGFVAGYGAVGVWTGLVIGLVVAAAWLMYRFWAQTLPRMTRRSLEIAA
nr:MATE family efflux transporter [Tropicimonas sp. IMCC34043]